MAEISLETIKNRCGYTNYDAMRNSWTGLFQDLRPFPEDKAASLPKGAAIEYLSRLSKPYPNKSQAVIQGALSLLESLQKGEAPQPSVLPVSPPTKKPVVRKSPVPSPEVQPEDKVLTEAELRVRLIALREEEDRQARLLSRADERTEIQRKNALNAKLSPWINRLTWGLNGLEMLFLIGGLFVIAGAMGLVVGLFLAVLGAIVLLQVQIAGNAGGYAVFAWFLVCGLGGWLVEFPAMLQAVESNGSIIAEDGTTYAAISTGWYAGLITMLMSGSSFAGTYFRYIKTQE